MNKYLLVYNMRIFISLKKLNVYTFKSDLSPQKFSVKTTSSSPLWIQIFDG